MKRLILASALSAFALSASAVEIGAPYEQLNIDRQLPNIEFAPVEPYVAASRAPFEQPALHRALPGPPPAHLVVAPRGAVGPRPPRPFRTAGKRVAAPDPAGPEYASRRSRQQH